ncbi:GL20681 [Drosophila persimilis]|uniref:GL20681 n=1 Tax=Drosophila persimilis TaxID=7234 RepID=B4IS01_DROPE|nr:GL20681 [Drosophila persimilis]
MKGIKTERGARFNTSKVKRLYHQGYRAEWESIPSFSLWLRPSNDGYSAQCQICDATVLARLASVKQHHNTRKHQESMKCNEFLSMNMIKAEDGIIPNEPKPKPKPKAKAKPKMKIEKIEAVEDHEMASNDDSILDDLLGNESLERAYLSEGENVDEREEQHIGEPETEELETEMIQMKHDDVNGVQLEDMHEVSIPEENIMSEFDLFGKSVSLQLNHMDLEDALMCQERLQVVLTEYRLKILKRNREAKRST